MKIDFDNYKVELDLDNWGRTFRPHGKLEKLAFKYFSELVSGRRPLPDGVSLFTICSRIPWLCATMHYNTWCSTFNPNGGYVSVLSLRSIHVTILFEEVH